MNGCVLALGVDLDYLFIDRDITNALKQFKNGKSPKHNGVPNEIWKVVFVNSELREVMRILFNACLLQGRIVGHWRNRCFI